MVNIYYDGECPFCTRYVQMLRLGKATAFRLIDLREAPDKVAEFEAAGYSLDEGMVVQADGRDYHGSDAVSYLAALSTPSDALNRLNKAALSNPVAAKVLYPVLRGGRWFALFLLNRNMLGQAEDTALARREIFASLFALFSIFHALYAGLAYGSPSWDLVLLLMAAVVTLARPARAASLFVLATATMVSGIVQLPSHSNHALLALLTSIAYLASVLIAMVRNDAPSRVFERFAPAGCGLLLVMYFFGVFHKINADFLNPLTSCATTLWRAMPAPLAALDGPVIEYGAIYGTFVVETLIAAALVTRRFRHWGIAAGMAFHLLLSLSAYAMYIAFSVLTISLHSLFLNEGAARSILESPPLRLLKTKLREPVYWLLLIALLSLIAVSALIGNYSEASLVALILILPFCYAILRYGASAGGYPRTGFILAGIVAGLYFVNCSLPYLGLKTAQAGNMFANLRLEAGVSNHLVFSADRRPFRYLDDVATFEGQELGIVYYDLLDRLERNPDLRVTYEMGGVTYVDQSASTLKDDIAQTLHPEWFRKWFHFQPVYLGVPERCNT